jgi:multiple sugar transport system substrate-binding protein
MFKKAGAVLLSAALVASLAACSGSGGGGGDGDDPTKPMTLNLSTWTYTTPAVIQYWDEAVAGFKKKHPKVTVKINQIPLADYPSSVVTQMSAGQSPDLIHIPTPMTTLPAWADAGFLYDMGDFLKTTDIPKEWPEAQSVMKWKGVTYGVEIAGYGYQLFYNKDLLEKAGVDVPRTPDELLAAAKAVQDLPTDNYGFAVTDDGGPALVQGALQILTGLKAPYVKGGKWNLTSPKVVDAIDYFRKLGTYSPKGADGKARQAAYLAGSVAMMIDGPFYWATVRDTAEASIKDSLRMAETPFPAHPGQVSNGISIAAGLSGSKLAMAEQFVKYLVSPAVQKNYSQLANIPVARPGASDGLKSDPLTAPVVAAAADNVQITDPAYTGLRVKYPDFVKLASASLHQMLTSDVDTKKALEDLQTALINAGIKPVE